MTINYDKYPSLKIFENDKSVISFLKKVIPEEISNKKKTERILLYLIRKATPNIEIITQTFVDAIERSECSFQKIDRMAFFKENRECGAFVTKKVTFIYVSNEVSSNLFIVDGKEVRAIIEYEFSKETISTIFNKGLNIPAYLTFLFYVSFSRSMQRLK